MKKWFTYFFLILFINNSVYAEFLVHKMVPIKLPDHKLESKIKNKNYFDWSNYGDQIWNIRFHTGDNPNVGIHLWKEFIKRNKNNIELSTYLDAHYELMKQFHLLGNFEKAISVATQILNTYDVKKFKNPKPEQNTGQKRRARNSLNEIEWLYIDILIKNKQIKLACNLNKKFEKKMLSTFGEKRRLHFIKEQYNYNNCSKVLGLVGSASIDSPENSKKTLTGFKIDLRENDTFIRDNFSEYLLIFDFSKFKVNQKISNKEININNEYEIVNINKKKIVFQQSLKDYWSECQKKGDKHRAVYCDEKNDNFFYGKYMKTKNSYELKMVKDYFDKWRSTPLTDWHFENENQLKLYKENWSQLTYLDLNQPAIIMEYYPKKNNLKHILWPYGYEDNGGYNHQGRVVTDSNSDIDLNKQNLENLIKVLIFVATVYLVLNQVNNIKNIAKSSGNSSKITGKSSTFSNPKNFGNRSIQEKVKIFKYYRMYGF
ncbi:hypothetical protein N9332_00250 [Candidatus Pelagibacter sp.]|nr:hypothetical protein [Candidatus Pelagibacter sp.]